MNLRETQLNRQSIFHGNILGLRKDTVCLPDGNTAQREVIEHPGGCCVAALNEQNRLLMVRQFRYAVGRELWELPAGKLEPGEDPMVCAARELEEETGYRTEQLISLGAFYPTPAYCQEIIHMYYTRQLVPTRQHLDRDEFLEVASIPFEQAAAMVKSGEIADGKTALAILKLKEILP